ncbi:hypothetical protein J5226_10095 [Lysobacter sp. K5869]|uniref:hypothetical protein n=1 Tax=Lysobacter sp. K5869 TaxID=2820808 RepID=UPI001C06239E|nr:hypothetical protein [Lysobacter sp. K5869]QWP78714.1 hypothetical protein J5226_10095 [Lysobacter sp. K5869]
MERLLGEYRGVDAVRCRGGLTFEAEVRTSIGERALLGKEASRRRRNVYGLRSCRGTIRLIEVRDARRPREAPHRVFETFDGELREMRNGWPSKLRKRASEAGGIDNRQSSNSPSKDRK